MIVSPDNDAAAAADRSADSPRLPPRPSSPPSSSSPSPLDVVGGTGEWQRLVERMVREQLESDRMGRPPIRDGRVLAAFRAVNRALFVPASHRRDAFADHPLPIGCEQTISQPYMVAVQLEAIGLHGFERVLEIGTGSGYQTALLAHLCREVYSLERISQLFRSAEAVLLGQLRLPNVFLRLGDGSLGWPDAAPFDAIVVSAGAPSVPVPLLDQLAIGGRLCLPVQVSDPQYDEQRLTVVTRASESDFHSVAGMSCRFVKLYGAAGWPVPVPD